MSVVVIAVGTIAVFDMVEVLIPRNELQNGVALLSLRITATRLTFLHTLRRRSGRSSSLALSPMRGLAKLLTGLE